MSEEKRITRLLDAVSDGEDGAMEQLIRTVHADLQAMAERRLRSMFGSRTASLTIEPAALVNETYLKLIEQHARFENRRHFFSIISRIMMRVMIDYQRKRQASRRGMTGERITLSILADEEDHEPPTTIGLEDFDVALRALEELDIRKADIARMRVIWSMGHDQIAEAIGVSRRTVLREWRFAKTWLMREMHQVRADMDAANSADGSQK